MASPLETALLVAGLLTTAGGVLLALRGVHTVATRLMAAWLVLFGLEQVTGALFGFESRIYNVVTSLQFWSVLAFGVAYPGPGLSPLRRWVLVWLAIPCVALGFFLDFDPMRHGLTPGRLVGLAISVASLLGVPLLLAFHARRTQSPLQRDQLVWLLLPFLFWMVHDSAWIVLLPLVDPGLWAGLEDSGIIARAVQAAASLLLVLGFVVAAAVGAARTRGAERRPFLAILGGVLAFVLLAPLQFVLAGPTQAAFGPGADLMIHPLLDTLFSVLLFYGVARYGIVDLKLRLRWSLKHGTIASAFLAVFFLVSESATAFLGETTGSTYAGIAGAALLVFAFGPVHRLAERLSERAVPVAGGADAYLDYRRLRIYHAALEGALKDGRVDAWEADALAALRRELRVTQDEHALVEREVLAARAV